MTREMDQDAAAGVVDRPVPTSPCYDHEAFLGRLRGSEDLAAELVEIFLDDLPGQIRVVASGVADGRWSQVHLTAHRIKGASSSLGGLELQALAAAVEGAVAAGELEHARSLAPGLETAFERLREELRRVWPAGSLPPVA